uniref:UvrD-like helicase C-terminal domain-containing protein n=1 Tax=Candidatus Kentrum sp. FM TaxID=2126340 RepID=A0A450S7A2_9GAMM|nr:MAG: UvrD-like helicase C-terminal domain-containing protein [Candidatus Kentron sp. FM]VFJ48866.1 MAG: UvrD-like helicase C-terminal domain-containing protein [Candidatus Kentron sp. FM]VFK11282.1 MAG: UvrD-like helicase C-terminal domain-containing protein [Candidatus Kentron sp. FM]
MSPPNPELQLANDFVRYTNRNIFLTGKAGTGKTTFLRGLKGNSHKRMVITAPTGVAAINAGGATLHSFFQVPLGPFVPGSEGFERHQFRFSKKKRELLKNLDLLVIDEISMVRADLLDGVDAVLRRYRPSPLPFGGVQLLMIGDLHQLSPVVKPNDWAILGQYYDSPYFFSSNALGQAELVTIELKHIYRQSDSYFIELLNRVRDNTLDADTLARINQRYIPDFSPPDGEDYITLTTHNNTANDRNESKLDALTGKRHRFRAKIEGDFPEHSYPTLATLELKPAAQVMFVRNDVSPERRYFNGKIGKVTRIAKDKIHVKCPEDDEAIVVEETTWDNIDYKLDPETGRISEDIVGTFQQYPLRLAWAITIHKSQGLTFERAIIDAGAAFAHGQVYVALSRCKTLEGVVLYSPLSARAVKTDGTVSRFVADIAGNPPSREGLDAAKVSYQQRLLIECFDFRALGMELDRLIALLTENPKTLALSGAEDIHELEPVVREEIVAVGGRFERQLRRLFAANTLPESDGAIRERVTKASVYFRGKLDAGLVPFVRDVRIDTKNKALDKKARQTLELLEEEIRLKRAVLVACKGGFRAAAYLRAASGR